MRLILSIMLLSIGMTQAGIAPAVPFAGLVSLDEAVRSVMRQGQNKVLGTRTDTVDGGKRVYIIKVLTPDGRIQHIKIDSESGRQIR